MARKIQQRTPEAPPLAFLGQWMNRLEKKNVQVAKAAGVTEAYLSELISMRKKNPSFSVVDDIAAALGISVSELRRPPPPRSAIDTLQGLSPSTIERLKPSRDQ